ncbi:MAG: hypothetical protein JSR27_12965 [Proteobacteria bacterium]|nr:hypothetical protein [Pseudomonadota bacterium]
MVVKELGTKTRNVLLALLIVWIGFGSSIAVAQGNSGFALDYFHAYRATRTYAIQLQNGLSATFDFRQDTATLYAGTQTITLPLDQVLLQAANGNSKLAARMYNQMYDDITAAHSDAIMKSTGSRRAGSNSARALAQNAQGLLPGDGGGIGDQDDAMWGLPSGGDCWPIPEPCDQWPDGDSGPGLSTFTYWWNTPYGSDPLTSQPPNPDNCAPGDNDCRDWENNRKNACDKDVDDGLALTASAVLASAACVGALESGGLASYACAGAFAEAVRTAYNNQKDDATCNTPYPGHP